MFNYRFDVILPHKKFIWTDFGRVYTPIYPHRYAPDFHSEYSEITTLICTCLVHTKFNMMTIISLIAADWALKSDEQVPKYKNTRDNKTIKHQNAKKYNTH